MTSFLATGSGTGLGSTNADGVYAPVGTVGGKPQYQNNSKSNWTVFWSTLYSKWVWWDDEIGVWPGGSSDYVYQNTASTSEMPTSTWSDHPSVYYAGPAPTVTVFSGDDHAEMFV